MNRGRRGFSFAAALLILLSGTAVPSRSGEAAGTYQAVNVIINGKRLLTSPAARILNGRTLVPMRAVLEALGAEVYWQQETMTARASNEEHVVEVAINSDRARADGQWTSLDVPAMLIESRTFLPLRFTAESLGAKVDWDPATHTAIITSLPPPTEAEMDAILRSMGYEDSQLVGMAMQLKQAIARKTGGQGTLVSRSQSDDPPPPPEGPPHTPHGGVKGQADTP
jgi:hypothetical protein